MAAVSLTGHARAEEPAPRKIAAPAQVVPAERAAWRKANAGAGERVYGGELAEAGAWPFQVALLSTYSLDASKESQLDAQFCGGSLIAPNWVLTAAHCLVSDGQALAPEAITVLTDASNLGEGKRMKVAQVIVHEGFDKNMNALEDDIGLLKLAATTRGKTISLAKTRTEGAGEATVTGWGMLQTGTFPDGLMQVDVDLVTNQTCNAGFKSVYAKDFGGILRYYSSRLRIPESAIETVSASIGDSMSDAVSDGMICADVPDVARSACKGDSGGPLFIKDGGKITQIGVVSWGEGPMDASAPCGHADAFDVYTRVASYTDWIKKNTGLKLK